MTIHYDAVLFTDMSSKIWHVRPLGAYRLASELRNHGYQVLVVDFLSKWLQDRTAFFKLLKKIVSLDTIFVGYSGTFFSLDNQIKTKVDCYHDYFGSNAGLWPESVFKIKIINQYIKKLSPNCRIFYGGSKTGHINDSLKNSGVDYVVQGFADRTIVDIMQRLKKGRALQLDLQKSGTVKVINSDMLGRDFDFAHSITTFHDSDCIDRGEILPLETSRGCLFKCKFCSYPLIGRRKDDPDYHKKTNQLTLELVSNYKNFGINKYNMIDDTFNESTSKLRDIYQSLKQSSIDIEFSCYLRLDLLDKYREQIQLLYDMGMRSCFFGVETMNSQSAKAIGKSTNIDKIKQSLEHARQIWGGDVAIHASFIAGLPWETENTFNDWMSWVYDRSDLIDGYRINTLSLTQDHLWPSAMGKDPTAFGYQITGEEWINNMGMTSQQAQTLSDYWMRKGWESDRLKVAGWEMIGMQNFGYSFADLKHYSLRTLPYDDFAKKYAQRVAKYKQRLFDYIDSE